MKNVMIILLIGVYSCNSISVSSLNRKYIKSSKLRNDKVTLWDKDLITARRKAFSLLNIYTNNIDNVFLIERYNIDGLFYSGLLYIVDNDSYFEFYREGAGSNIKLQYRKLSRTDKFIIENLKTSKFDLIKCKSDNSQLMSSSLLYITTVNKMTTQQIKVLTYNDFYIDEFDDSFLIPKEGKACNGNNSDE